MSLHGRHIADLYDPRAGGQPLRLESLHAERGPYEPARTNYFAVYRIDSGSGTVAVDAVQCGFRAGELLFFIPYQYVRFMVEEPLRGDVIEFHANFLCVETFHAEVGCSGTLFNDPYGVPVLSIAEPARGEVADLFARIGRELAERGLAHTEAALAYLKVLLIVATRCKATGEAACGAAKAHRHPVLSELAALVERHYREWHSPARYADALHMTAKTLGRVVREHLGTTLTDLIRRRILTHAKWQLLHTLRPVKEIAREIGFDDELYFSRLFKKATGLSPIYFREFETAIRGGSNLSMPSSRASIPGSGGAADNCPIEADGPGGAGSAAADGTRRKHRRAKNI
jgi:AraC-like DNA-binding protein